MPHRHIICFNIFNSL